MNNPVKKLTFFMFNVPQLSFFMVEKSSIIYSRILSSELPFTWNLYFKLSVAWSLFSSDDPRNRKAILARFFLEAVAPQMLCNKGVLKNFSKLTGKQLCQSLSFNKAAGYACDFIKKSIWHRCFPANFLKLLSTAYFIEHLGWLLLSIMGLHFY